MNALCLVLSIPKFYNDEQTPPKKVFLKVLSTERLQRNIEGTKMYWLLHELNIVLTYWQIRNFLNFKIVLLFWFLFLALAIKIVITNKETIVNRTPLVLDFPYDLLSTLEDPWGIKHLRLYKRRLLTCKSLVGFTQIKKLEMQF